MNLDLVLQKAYFKTELYVKRNSSFILTCISAVGVVGTAITVAKATPKAVQKISNAENEKGEELNIIEQVIVAGPVYVPSVAIGVSTIVCLFAANILNKKHQTALTSAYMLAESTYKDYRNKTKELFGEEADTKILDAIAKDKRKEDWTVYAPGVNNLDLSGDNYLFYDEFGRRFFEATMNDVLNAEYHLNRNFALRGWADINEFYGFLGLDESDFGDTVGWIADIFYEDGLGPWIDFDHRKITLDDGSEFISIGYVYEPTTGYDEGYEE